MEEKNYEELFIFSRMVEGDKTAFRFFFDKYYTYLCNFVNIYLHDSITSEEIVEDIFVYFWEKREKIEIKSSIKSYLFTASRNKSLNYLRHEKIKLIMHEKLNMVEEPNYEISERAMDVDFVQEILKKSIDKLPPKCREIFILTKHEHLSYKEIAMKFDISVSTVENQMGKAFKMLRKILKPYYNDLFVLLCFSNFFMLFVALNLV